ncbi:hypothetical protein GQR58_025034 [Nymphon striatum]|nr:hypothetical protein GQR58_025034 [Nymphon striatum]
MAWGVIPVWGFATVVASKADDIPVGDRLDKDWYGAKQILILSASSKTSTGLGYALKRDKDAPTVIGVTSRKNIEIVKGLNIYDQCLTYEEATTIDASIPTVIVDMSGNAKVLAALHIHLGDQMKFTSNKRLKDWGPEGFDQKTSAFLVETAAKTKKWLKFKQLNGLHQLAQIHPMVCIGALPPDEGLIIIV